MGSSQKKAVFLVAVILAAGVGLALLLSPKFSTNGTVVIAWGWNESEVRQVLKDYFGIYDIRSGDEILDGLQFLEERLVEFQLSVEFDTEKTFYLVNYFSYPHALNLKGREVGALALAQDLESRERDQPIGGIVYVPYHDEEYDQVYVRDEKNDVYLVSFTNFSWVRKVDPRLPPSAFDVLDRR